MDNVRVENVLIHWRDNPASNWNIKNKDIQDIIKLLLFYLWVMGRKGLTMAKCIEMLKILNIRKTDLYVDCMFWLLKKLKEMDVNYISKVEEMVMKGEL